VTSAGPAIAASPQTRSPGDLQALSLEGIVQRWPTARQNLLSDLDLALAPGSVTRLTGRNGAGKTTVLRIAAGLIRPASGRVSGFGADPFDDRRRYQELVGYLPAGSVGLYARLSPRQHLDFVARLALLPSAVRRAAVDRELVRFGLVEIGSRRVDRLSMGQRQRVRLALAMVSGPRIVLLDEPLSSLDDDGVALLRAVLEQTVADDGAVMWCSPHEDDLGLSLDQSLVLERGRVWPA
jgi:ABC-2 type transport system ATP-binding protein